MEKKNIAITVLIVALVASGVGNIVLVILGTPEPTIADTSAAYRRSTSSGPKTLEITDSWDSASNDVLEQVVETLFFYDIFDPNLPLINLLAYDYFWASNTSLQIRLREGIKFHDGTAFNAEAAKWNLDRLCFLTNCTGTNTGEVAHTQSLWMFPDFSTPIINNVATVGEYNITITLNGAYAPFLATLSYINAGMISPTAHANRETSFLTLNDKPIGTGPFMYDRYVPDVEVRLKRWDGYWMPPANFPWVIYAIYDDSVTAHNAFLGLELDANPMASDQDLLAYEADAQKRFTVKRLTTPSLVYQYLGFNNNKYNMTWRKAFSWAFNYTYIIDELRLGNAYRAYSPISPGWGLAYNVSCESTAVPNDGDIKVAREVVQSMGFGLGLDTNYPGNNETEWIAAAEGTTPYFTVSYQYNTGPGFRRDVGVAVADWLGKIGVAVIDEPLTWSAFLDYLFDDFDSLGIYCIGWAPDYKSPYNMLDPLFNPLSDSNSAQVNDAGLNALMAAALTEIDETARNDIYKDIQYYIQSHYFHAPMYHSKITGLHLANIAGVSYNTMGTLRIYPMYRTLFPPFNTT